MYINRYRFQELMQNNFLRLEEISRASDNMSRSHLTRILNGGCGLTPDAKTRIEMGLMILNVNDDDIKEVFK